jgi:hypothetical protein
MVKDSAQFSVTTSFAAIPVPSNGMEGLLAAVSEMKPDWIVLEQAEFEREREQIEATFHPVSTGWVPGSGVVALRLKH